MAANPPGSRSVRAWLENKKAEATYQPAVLVFDDLGHISNDVCLRERNEDRVGWGHEGSGEGIVSRNKGKGHRSSDLIFSLPGKQGCKLEEAF